MDDPWSDDDDDILLSQAADKTEQSVHHETESDDDLILSQSLEQVEEHLQSVSNPHSSSFPESDDDDLVLSQSLTETEKYLQTVANLSTGFPESDGDDLILSQTLTEAEGILQGDTNILRNGISISRSAASSKSESGQDLRDVNQNQTAPNTLTHSQGSLKQSTETMFRGQSSFDAEVVNVSDDEDEINTRSVETTAGSSESVAGPSDGGQHQKQVDEELQKQKKSLEQVKNTFDSELQCSICNELFVQATSLNCAHAFCALCISQWLRTSRACPMCRTTVTSKTRSIALDNFIDKMCEHLGEGMKEDRQSLLETREREQAQFDANYGNQPNHSSSPTSPLIVRSEPDSLPDSPSYDASFRPYSPTYASRAGWWSPTSPGYHANSWSETSSSSDSLYSTDSSATDFSDHSPRSRQRRREMRHRERRRRRQHRRNRNTNSDSSMSHGRRIDWRRRRRSRSRRGRNERNKRRQDRRRRNGEETESSSDYSDTDSSSDDQSRHRRRWRLERRSSHDRSRRDRDWDSTSDYSQSVSGGDNSGERASRDRNRQRGGRWRRIHSDSGDSNGSRDRYRRRRDADYRGGTGRHSRRQRERDGSSSTERRRDRSRHLPRIISSDDDSVNNGGSGRENEQGSRQWTRTRTRRDSDQTENNEQASSTSRRSDRNERANNGRTSGVGNNTSRSVMVDGSSNNFGGARTSRTSTNYENDNSTASTSRGTRPLSSQSPFTRPYYGGYGQCFKCGRSGHWANGCTYR